MKYIDRRLLFPVAAAATVWAQQPVDPATAQAEAALRARVDEFYKLQVDKKFRQAESMIAEDSKDDYYNRAKQDIKGFSIQQIELLDNNSRAKVTAKGKVVLKAPLVGAQEFELSLVTWWKIENGQWVWYINRETDGQTPFGIVRPSGDRTADTSSLPAAKMDVDTLMNQITIDRLSVNLNASNPEQTVIVTNHLPGSITLELSRPQLGGVSIELKNSEVRAGGTSAIQFRLTDDAKSSGVVRLVASPLNKVFAIQVNLNQQ